MAEQQTMRNGQNNKRMRGRSRKGGHHHQNPLSRMYESNGPDVKIRGTASHIAEKYLQLARDAQSSGDPIAAENYYQHAEHYFRLIAAAQEQLRQNQPYFQQQQPGGGVGGNMADDGYDDGDDQPQVGEPYAPQSQQFYQREPQHNQHQPQHNQHQPQHYQSHQPQQHQPQHQPQQFQPRPQPQMPDNDGDVERLPSFITGGQPQQQGAPQNGQGANGQGGGNGPNGYDGSPDRFPLHRRRRRHRGGGPRDYGSDQSIPAENSAPQTDADSVDE
ncbi:MAG: DUF4167 domain-containing protein [Xanthobacteraceae bacterium]